jgi:hypothetical protein
MTKRWTAALLVLPLLLGVAACGDDDDDTDEGSSASASEEEAAGGDTCQTWLDITAAFNGEPTIEQMDPLFDDLTANAPEEIADDVEVATTTAREVLETGNFELFETPEMGEALANADGYHFEHCEADEKLEITAVDYAFTGLPEELPAGTVFLEMTNATTHGEAHEIGIARKKDGVTETWDEILALGEEESDAKIEFVGGGFAEAEGDVGYVFLQDLAPGEYLAACFVPVGGEEEGAPHFTEGMLHEFTVS